MHPHDTADLRLAPVALQVDAQVQKLSAMTTEQLTYYLASELDRNPGTQDQRARDIVDAATHSVDLGGWKATWDPRGVRLTHGEHSLVIGVGAVLAAYVSTG